MRIILIVILLVAWSGLRAQRGTGYSAISRMMKHIPDSVTFSSQGIADYINTRITDQKQKSWAIFSWIAGNMHYEFDSIFANNYYQTPAEVSEQILKNRTGVCLQYAYLFSDIANKAGIKSYVIQGYTRQHGVVDWLPHVWCAAFIDTAWYLFDPTWGSGYVSNKRFFKQVNTYYFMTKPEDLIFSHMPFDPLWQFLHYPVTNQEFYDRNFRANKNKAYFNYIDSLQKYEGESELERYVSSAGRIEQNGVLNAFISTKLRILRGEIEYYRKKAVAVKYNAAVDSYNEGINLLNKFIHYRNNQFYPLMDSLEMKQMLDSSEYFLTASVKTLTEIKDPEENMAASIILLKKSLHNSFKVLNTQKDNLNMYLRTRK